MKATQLLAASTALTIGLGLSPWNVSYAQQGIEVASASLSADGGSVALLVSSGSGATSGSQVLVFRRETGELIQVHLNSDGNPPGDFDVSGTPSLSADGDVVAMASFADLDLNNPDGNGTVDAYVRLIGGADTRLLSINNSGVQSDAGGQFPVVSGDGGFVAFQTVASNVDPMDNDGGNHDIFVRDLVGNQTILVSLDEAGGQLVEPATDPRISSDGQRVAFEVFVGGGQGNILRIADVQSGTSAVASLDDTGQPLSGSQTLIGDLSGDGRWLTFQTNAPATADDSNGLPDVFVRDLMLGATFRVSQAMLGQQPDGGSADSRISADGNFVAFESLASNLVAGDTNGQRDVFLLNRMSGDLQRVSVASDGSETDQPTLLQGLSADGRFVLLRSISGALAPGAEECSATLACNVFLHDTQTGNTTRVPTPNAITFDVPSPAPLVVDAGFGSAVAINGSDLVIGVPGSQAAGSAQGAVEVYRLREGQPVSVETLVPPMPFTGNGFGAAVAISGDVLVIGSRPNTVMGKSVGAGSIKGAPAQALEVAVYQRSNGVWSFSQNLTGASLGVEFGHSVAVQGQRILIGAPGDIDANSAASGAVYLFSRASDAEDFALSDRVEVEGLTPNARFGASVALRNGIAVVGAPQDIPGTGSNVTSGSYSTFDINAGMLQGIFRGGSSSAMAGDRFGESVAVSELGMVAVGAPGEAGLGGGDEGAVYLTAVSGSTPQRLVPNDPVPGGQFGASVSITGATLAVGSPGAQVDNSPVGALYRFALDGASATLVRRRSAPSGQGGYGSVVAASRDRVVIGAPDENGGAAQLVTDPQQLLQNSFED
ncbi:MAG: hypothetical protein AB8B96_03070 [Lysobacterales bacterium]